MADYDWDYQSPATIERQRKYMNWLSANDLVDISYDIHRYKQTVGCTLCGVVLIGPRYVNQHRWQIHKTAEVPLEL